MNNFIATIILIFWAVASFGQPINKHIDDVLQPSPDQASLGKYGDVPIGYYSGVPSIGIPIHTLSQGPLSHSVALSYHSGGIRGEEMASRVGLGWTLAAGGSVTRTINGYRDEDYRNKGYYLYGQEIIFPTPPVILRDIAEGQRDGEPDLFSFSCGGYSGKFYFNSKKEPVLVPLQDIKITTDFKDGQFASFTIITPEGNRHIFGEYGNTKAYDDTYGSLNEIALRTSWHLLRTETFDQTHGIDFGYENNSYSYTSTSSCRAYSAVCSGGAGSGFSSEQRCSSGSFYQFGQAEFYYNTTNIVGKRLKEIKTLSETVTFTSSTDRTDLGVSQVLGTNKKSLDEIEISMGANLFCKKFSLSYDYFVDDNHLEDDLGFEVPAAKRLKLTQVAESACDGSITIPPHVFDYDETTMRWRHTKAIDHWGYPNGQVNNNNSLVNVPSTTIVGTTFQGVQASGTFGESDRDTREAPMMAGILKKITYPTGGSSSFEYEANRHTVDGVAGIEIFKQANCITPDATNCCGNPSVNIISRTFTAEQLVNPEITLTLNTLFLGGICGDNTATMILKVLEPGNNIPIISESFNIDQIEDPDNPGSIINPEGLKMKLCSSQDEPCDIDLLQPGVPYTFEIQVTDGWGILSFVDNTPVRKDELVGGLRVTKVTTHDALDSDKDIIKTFEYLAENEESSGVLYYRPEYGIYVSGVSLPISGGQLSINSTAIWKTTSFVPMSSYENQHIAYDRVIEHHNGNGRKVYEYDARAPFSFVGFYPAPPNDIIVTNGKEVHQKTFLEGELINAVAETETQGVVLQSPIEDQDDFIARDLYYRLSEVLPCSVPATIGNGSGGSIFYSTYRINPRAYRVGTVTSTIDGVSTTQTMTYDYATRQLGPISVSMTNSDGKIYRTENTYIHDYAQGLIRDQMIAENRIGAPWKVIQKVGEGILDEETIVDGTQMTLGFFSPSTGELLNDFSSTGRIYPYLQFRREITWDEDQVTKIDKGLVLQQTALSYDADVGKPSKVLIDGWADPIEYKWKPTGRMEQWKFINFEKNYTYFPGTYLLQKFEAIDETEMFYNYDKLWRLKTLSNCQGATTTIDYNYKITDGGDNFVRTTLTYPRFGEELQSQDIVNKQIIDGLGRSIQTLRVNQAPDDPTKHIAAWTEYDRYSRPIRQYEPLTVSSNAYSQADPNAYEFTLTEYEPSPLNRPISVTPPSWYPTTTTYGANDSGDVLEDHIAESTFGANELAKVTSTDPNGNKSIAYTDKRGRVVLTRMEDGSDSNQFTNTYTLYDDKDRTTTVIPPGSDINKTSLNFLYTYYTEDLVATKDLPDRGVERYSYNNRHLLTFRQDAVMKADLMTGTYVFDHDPYGRVVREGFTLFDDPLEHNTYDAYPSAINELIMNTYNDEADQHKDKLKNTKVYRVTKQAGEEDDFVKTSFVYDGCSRMLNTTVENKLIFAEPIMHSMTYDYDDANNMIRSTDLIPNLEGDLIVNNFMQYDHVGRSIGESIQIADYAPIQLSNFEYSAKEQIKTLYQGGVTNALQECNYEYLPNRFLKQMNDPDNKGQDLFAMSLYYDDAVPSDMGISTPRLNGDISGQRWTSAADPDKLYSYGYDYLNRLESADYNVEGRFNTSYGYDKRGNIKSLTRKGAIDTDGVLSYDNIDLLQYNIPDGSNQIESITDAITSSGKGFNLKSNANYTYDDNGNMIFDPGTNATMTYSYLNLPDQIMIPDSGLIKYDYMADGSLLKKETIRDDNPGEIDVQRQYIGAYEYIKDTLRQINTSQGYILFNKEELESLSDRAPQAVAIEYIGDAICLICEPTAEPVLEAAEELPLSAATIFYNITDHLGNNRITYTQGTEDLEVVSEDHYYPFGLQMSGDWSLPNTNEFDYRYNGKEVQKEFDLGYYNYGARFYDPSIARFTGVDPLASSYASLTPYHYVMNNPLIYIDPDGRNTVYFGSDGQKLYETEDDFDNAIVIVGDDNLEAFNNAITDFDGSESAIGGLRGLGDNYMIDGMISFFDNNNGSIADQSDVDSEYQVSMEDGSPVIAEVGGFLERKEGNTICVSDCQFSSHNPHLVEDNLYTSNNQSEDIVGRIHTHPNSGKRFNREHHDPGNFPSNSVVGDKRRSNRKSGTFDAVVDNMNIILYNRNVQITAKRSFFRK